MNVIILVSNLHETTILKEYLKGAETMVSEEALAQVSVITTLNVDCDIFTKKGLNLIIMVEQMVDIIHIENVVLIICMGRFDIAERESNNIDIITAAYSDVDIYRLYETKKYYLS